MKPFSFRLESVLNYRKFIEKKALMGLMREKKAYSEIEMSISRFKSKRSDAAKKINHAGLNGINASLYHLYKSFLNKLRDDIEKAFVELKEKEREIKEQEMVLKNETTKRKALEKLRDIRFEEHRNVAEKAEQKYLDELVINQRRARA